MYYITLYFPFITSPHRRLFSYKVKNLTQMSLNRKVPSFAMLEFTKLVEYKLKQKRSNFIHGLNTVSRTVSKDETIFVHVCLSSYCL